MATDGDATGRDDVTDEVYEMSTTGLDELFSFADDPEFLEARRSGHIAFLHAVLDASTQRVDEAPTGRHRQSGRPDDAQTKRQQRLRVASDGEAAAARRGRGGTKKGSRMTGTQRDKLVRDLRRSYERGASVRALAEETGRSYGFVRRLLDEAGAIGPGRTEATSRGETESIDTT